MSDRDQYSGVVQDQDSAHDQHSIAQQQEQELKTTILSDKEESSLRNRFQLLTKGKVTSHRDTKDTATATTSTIQYLSSKELERLPELAANPLGNRIIEWILDGGDQNGLLSLDAFIGRMSVFSANAGRESKMKLAFSIYDVDNDGT